MQNKLKDAEQVFERILVLTTKAKGKNDPMYAKALNDLGGIYFLQKKYDKAKPAFEETLTILESTLGKTNPNLSIVLDNIAQVYTQTGNISKAAEYKKRADALRTQKQLPS